MSNSVTVVGLGYIGLPTATVLANHGYVVQGVEVNRHFIDEINNGRVPFVEPALAEQVEAAVSGGTLVAQTHVGETDNYIIAVPTPFQDDHQVDLAYIDAATEAICPALRPGVLVVLESTSPPGTTEHVAELIAANRPDLVSTDGELTVLVAHCPERVLPGKIMEEMVTNDRVIGGITTEAAEAARDLYASFCQGQLHLTNARTAELAKLAENSFRDVNIAYANELSLICDHLDIDVWELIELANKHPRVNILQPGPGVGGHCIAVDPWFIVSSAPEQARIIRLAREINDGKPEWVIGQVVSALADATISDPTVAVFGLAFKPDIDDLRESPAVEIAEKLAVGTSARVLAVEPNVTALPARLADCGVELASLERALIEADVIALLVDHQEFRALSTQALTGKRVIDTKGLWR